MREAFEGERRAKSSFLVEELSLVDFLSLTVFLLPFLSFSNDLFYSENNQTLELTQTRKYS